MALQPGQRTVGIRPPSGAPGGVDARIPIERNLGISEAANSIVRPLVAQEEERIRQDFTDRANAAEMGRDAQGNLQRPADPEGMGTVAARAWREAIDRRFVFQSSQDFSVQMDEVRAQSNNDPDAFRALGTQALQARLLTIDPRLRGIAEPIFTREYGERLRQITQRRSELESQATETSERQIITSAAERAALAFARGDDGEGEALLRMIPDGFQRLRSMGRDMSTPEQVAAQVESWRLAGRVLRQVDLSRTTDPAGVVRLSESFTNPDADGALGFTGRELTNMEPRVRTWLADRVQRAATAATREAGILAEQQRITNLDGLFDRFPNSTFASLGVNEADRNQVVLSWAQRNNVRLDTPEALQLAFDRFGEVPAVLTDRIFRDIRLQPPRRVEEVHQMFMAADGVVVDRQGLPVNLTSTLRREDAAFLENYTVARRNNPPEEAVTIARQMLDRGLAGGPEDRRRFLRQQFGVNNDTDLTGKLAAGFGNMFGFSEVSRYGQIPSEARELFETEVTQLVLRGVGPTRAQEIARDRFLQQWTQDAPFTFQAGMQRQAGNPNRPWVQRSTLPPAIFDPRTGQPSHDYVRDAVNLFVAERVADDTNGVQRSQLRFGVNLFLQPPANPTQNPAYSLVHIENGFVTPLRLRGEGGQSAGMATIYLGRVIAAQQEFVRNYQVGRAAADREISQLGEASVAAMAEGNEGEVARLEGLRADAQRARGNLEVPSSPSPSFRAGGRILQGAQAAPEPPRFGPQIRAEDMDPPAPLSRARFQGNTEFRNASADSRARRLPVPRTNTPVRWEYEIDQAVSASGVDRDLLVSLIGVESSWNPNATSRRGARGLAQLMDPTARELAARHGGDPSQPGDNLRLGALYLRQMLGEFNGDEVLAVAAYNMGPNALRDFMQGGRQLPDETVGHVMRVFRLPNPAEARLEIMRRARGE